jgi:hypothetical protein
LVPAEVPGCVEDRRAAFNTMTYVIFTHAFAVTDNSGRRVFMPLPLIAVLAGAAIGRVTKKETALNENLENYAYYAAF